MGKAEDLSSSPQNPHIKRQVWQCSLAIPHWRGGAKWLLGAQWPAGQTAWLVQ